MLGEALLFFRLHRLKEVFSLKGGKRFYKGDAKKGNQFHFDFSFFFSKDELEKAPQFLEALFRATGTRGAGGSVRSTQIIKRLGRR